MSDPLESDRHRSAHSSAMSLGLQWAAGMSLCTAGGYQLDQWRGGGSAFTLAGILLGMLYGAYEVWKLVRVFNELDKKTQNGPPNP